MKRTRTAVSIALAVASTLLIAQTPPQPPSPTAMVARQLGDMTAALNLTSAQQQQATTIFTNAATAESKVHENLRTARRTLKTAVINNDGAGIDQAATTIGGLITQLVSLQAKAHAAFYQILTVDQQSKLAKLESQHGPGGHNGPPPGGPGGSGHD